MKAIFPCQNNSPEFVSISFKFTREKLYLNKIFVYNKCVLSAKLSAAPKTKEVIIDTAAATNQMQEAIKHEVHVQELEMRAYYLPILIGSGVGFIILVLTLSLVICCCCKRKLKRKMKMAKEAEKPPLEGMLSTSSGYDVCRKFNL